MVEVTADLLTLWLPDPVSLDEGDLPPPDLVPPQTHIGPHPEAQLSEK